MRETLKTTVGRVSEIDWFEEFCEMAMLADSEKGVPVQLFE